MNQLFDQDRNKKRLKPNNRFMKPLITIDFILNLCIQKLIHIFEIIINS